MDNRLEEQLERVRQMSARIAQIQKRLAETKELIARDRESISGSPLNNVRDVRPWSSPGHSRESEPIDRDNPSPGAKRRTRRRPTRRRRR
jgi:hypothetical protein